MCYKSENGDHENKILNRNAHNLLKIRIFLKHLIMNKTFTVKTSISPWTNLKKNMVTKQYYGYNFSYYI